MERRSILEKLGLIEKIENEADDNEQTVNEKEQIIPVETEKPQLKESKIQIDAQVDAKEKPATEVKPSNAVKDLIDPIAVVKKKRLLKIEEIYNNYNVNSEGIKSVCIIESFQKALPDYLPKDVKRESILNIIASSNVQAESLLKDGNDKLNCLKDFSQSFINESNDIILSFENEITELNEKIKNFKTAIDNMKSLQNEQDFTVKYEIDKINNILEFLNPEIY
ncbi:MAG: hypothetical protein PHS04_03480 [Tissierellia bacterium]|nr:hypothetical protein [Tissierellia bacterium]MDD4437080.1 hypothetical protein [Tissierellia bacterium]